MMKKILFLFFCLISLSFAQNWLQPVAIALFAATLVLVLLFMLGYGFGIDQLRFLATEELYQVILTAAMVVIIIGSEASINSFFSDTLGAYLGESGTFHELAATKIENTFTKLDSAYDSIQSFSKDVAHESTMTYMCNFLGAGFFISGCTSYSTLLYPSSIAFQMIGIAYAELQSLSTLMNFAINYAFILLLPAGAFLRTFRVTRGAGGLLIAFAVTFYFVLPLSIIFMSELTESYEDSNAESTELAALSLEGNPIDFTDIASLGFTSTSGDYCAVGDMGETNPTTVKNIFKKFIDKLEGYVYTLLVKITLSTVVVIFICITILRWLTAALGAEIDVTSLAKIA